MWYDNEGTVEIEILLWNEEKTVQEKDHIVTFFYLKLSKALNAAGM